jgi:hypothetical protein
VKTRSITVRLDEPTFKELDGLEQMSPWGFKRISDHVRKAILDYLGNRRAESMAKAAAKKSKPRSSRKTK